MTLANLHYSIESARAAHSYGHVLTADVYLRHALSCANHLKRSDYRAAIMRCRNRLRPAVVARKREVV